VNDGSGNTKVPTALKGKSLESSYYKNRTPLGVRKTKPGAQTVDDIVIVPNPYSISNSTNQMTWPGEPNQIMFMNLPEKCTLKIYTATGDLVNTIEHTRGATEPWIDMRTESNQYPVSGVYILYVVNAKTETNEPLPNKIAKFVIVR